MAHSHEASPTSSFESQVTQRYGPERGIAIASHTHVRVQPIVAYRIAVDRRDDQRLSRHDRQENRVRSKRGICDGVYNEDEHSVAVARLRRWPSACLSSEYRAGQPSAATPGGFCIFGCALSRQGRKHDLGPVVPLLTGLCRARGIAETFRRPHRVPDSRQTRRPSRSAPAGLGGPRRVSLPP